MTQNAIRLKSGGGGVAGKCTKEVPRTLLILSGTKPPKKDMGQTNLAKKLSKQNEQTNPGKQDLLKWSPNHQIQDNFLTTKHGRTVTQRGVPTTGPDPL